MQLTFATPNDKAAVMALYDLCFPGEHAYCEYYHNHFWKPERCLLTKEGNELLAMVNLMDVTMTSADGPLEATYIFAAATHPDHRGKGLMGTMLNFSFGMDEAEGKDLSVLLTENDSLFAYYDRFGYQSVFAVSEIKPGEEAPLPMCKVRMLTAADAEILAGFYSAASAGRLAIARDVQRWTEILEEYNEHVFGLFDQSGDQLMAYALMDEQGIHANELLGIGAEYLLWCCSMKPEEAVGRTMPFGQNVVPVGCAMALSPRGEAAMKKGLPPYLNILFN